MFQKKTIVIGLDAATWSLMEPLIEAGELPNIAQLKKSGVSGNLTSTTPPMTPLAWNSIVTGVNPGKHGIYDFVKQNRNNYEVSPIVSDGIDLDVPAIWDLLNQQDQRVGVMNFPLSYPPPEVDPFFVSGISSPESGSFTYPQEIKDLLKEKDYRIHPKFGAKNNPPDKYISEVEKLTDIQLDTSFELLKHHNLDMFWVVFMGVDWIQHYLWNDEINGESAVNRIYRYMDEVVGKLLDSLGDKWNILVLSDHGFHEIKGEIHLNNLLEKWGYLERSELDRSMVDKMQDSALKKGKEIAKKFPQALKQKIKDYLPEVAHSRLQQVEGSQTTLHKRIDWGNTKAFSYGYMGRIYIHSKEDYPKGTVRKENYKTLREEIISRLENLKTLEGGNELVGNIYRKEEAYEGRYLDQAPDVVFEPKDFSYMFYGDFGDNWFHRPVNRVADHDDKGVYILNGEGVKSDVELDANLLDIAPTLLHWQGLPVLENMDGHVLKESFQVDFLDKHPIQRKKLSHIEKQSKGKNTKDEAEEEEVVSKLEDLGYL